jgi:thioester reductase-like protein
LDEETRADLQRSVGWIVHAAAKLDFLRPYSRMRAANVDGVRAVIELCGGGRPKRLVHLSSVSVLETPRLAGRVLDETASLDWPDTLPTGYARTKWVADRMVLHAARRGLQAHIIRPPWIAGSAAGTAEASADFLLRFIAACARMEAIPDTVTGWHVVTADFVARAVLLAVDGRLPPGVWHTGSPDRVGMDDIASALRARGVRTARSPQETWLKRVAEAAGRDPHHPFAALAGLFAPGGAAWLYGQGGVAKMDCERTLRALADHRVRPGPIDVDALAAAALARFPPSLT